MWCQFWCCWFHCVGFENTEFECETQSVTPLDFYLRTYGWTDAIDFSGTTTCEASLTGVVEVRFPIVSDWLAPMFQSMGMDHTQCVQSFELTLSHEVDTIVCCLRGFWYLNATKNLIAIYKDISNTCTFMGTHTHIQW